MSESHSKSKRLLRQADVRISLVMIIVCAFFLWQTRTFPMTGDFGGVESQWYVSPALFPGVLLLLLFACAVYLFTIALREGGLTGLLHLQSWLGSFSESLNLDRWYVIFLLVVYVYITIPSIDFYLATSVFLVGLLYKFYHPNSDLVRTAVWLQVWTVVTILGLRWLYSESFYLISLEPVYNEQQLLWNDGLVVAGLLFSVYKFFQQPVKAPYLLTTVFAVPLFLVFSFNFLLQVPMPVEYGSVIRLLEFFWYDLFSL